VKTYKSPLSILNILVLALIVAEPVFAVPETLVTGQRPMTMAEIDKALAAAGMRADYDPKVSAAISTGATAAGFSYDDWLVPCTDLTVQAMSFCDAGVEKMKRECK